MAAADPTRSRPADPAGAAAYLRRYPLDRVVAAIAARYRALGRVGGTAEVAEVTAAERETLEGFLGRRLAGRDWVGSREDGGDGGDDGRVSGSRAAPGGQAIRVRVREFADRLHDSRYAAELPDVLAAYYGERRPTRIELRDAEEARWRELFAGLLATVAPGAPPASGSATPELGARARRWLEAVRDGVDATTPSVRRLVDEQGDVACAAALLAVARALDAVGSGDAAAAPGRAAERVAVFATRLAGDPHAFDPDRPAGRLLLRTLEARYSEALTGLDEEPPAIRRGLVLAAAGLVQDGISSAVACYGVDLEGDDGTGTTSAAGLRIIPLRALGEACSARARGGVVYVVENPPVFETLVDAVEPWPDARRPTFVCTSGFLSVAAIRLLDLLVAGGARLLYSGDFDLNGIRILLGLQKRYGERLHPWRMDAEAYREAQSGSGRSDIPKRMSAVDRARLREWAAERGGELAPLLEAMAGHGTPAYQESLIRLLLTDVASRRHGVGAAE